MDTNYLREFVAVAKNANVTKTARLLGMSQPVLSKHVVAIEKEVGCELFNRCNNGFELTPHGRVFLESAQRLLIEYDRAMGKMARLKNKSATKLSICTYKSCKPTDDLVRRCRQSLKITEPLLSIEVRNAGPSSPIADVINGKVDVTLYPGNHSQIKGVQTVPLFREPLWAVVRRDHRLALRSEISTSELSGDIIWCSHEAPVARHYLDIQQMLEDAGVSADFMELPFNGTADALELNFDKGVYIDGAGIIAHSLSMLSLSREYVTIPITDCEQLQHLALYDPRNENPAVATFIEEMKKVLAEIDMRLYWKLPS